MLAATLAKRVQALRVAQALTARQRTTQALAPSQRTLATRKSREKLYPTIGLLYPEGTSRLIKATDLDAVRSAIDAFPDYRGLLSEGYDDDKTIEDQFFELEVNLNRLAFEQQFHYGARPEMQRAPTRTHPL